MTTATPPHPLLSPFSPTLAPPKRSVRERLTGISRPDLAQQGLRCALVSFPPGEILPSDINRVLSDYSVQGDKATEIKAAVWQEALEAFLSDGRLAEDEQAYLGALRRLFDLGQDTVEAI